TVASAPSARLPEGWSSASTCPYKPDGFVLITGDHGTTLQRSKRTYGLTYFHRHTVIVLTFVALAKRVTKSSSIHALTSCALAVVTLWVRSRRGAVDESSRAEGDKQRRENGHGTFKNGARGDHGHLFHNPGNRMRTR